MAAHIDYYFTPVSPWAYLGAPRFNAMVEKYGAVVQVMPVDLGRVFSVPGGLPLAKRAPQRQAYRMMELQRLREFLGMPLNLQPKGFPFDAAPSSRQIIAARQRSEERRVVKECVRTGRSLW